jgi:hypothetical protein
MRSKLSGIARLGLGAVAFTGMTLTTTSAKAACGYAPAGKAGIHMPMLNQAGADWHEHGDSIVGQWQTVYTATGGAIFNETIKQWHADGTEFESAFLPPPVGNICIGVWKEVGHSKVKLHHMGWLFDGSGTTTANGSFILDEEDTVAGDGKTYTGTFTFTPYSMDGTAGTPVTGTVKATRVTVD